MAAYAYDTKRKVTSTKILAYSSQNTVVSPQKLLTRGFRY